MGKSKWLCVLLGATLLGISPVFADDVVTDSDNYAKAISYNDVYATLGPIPKPSKELKLGYAAKAFENEFWRSVKEGAEAQSGEFKKQGMAIAVEVKAAQGEADEQGQLAIMNDMVNKKFDAIIASPISDGNLIPAIEKAQKAGIPLVNSIGGFVKEIPVYVGPRHFTSGQLAAEWVAQKIGKGAAEVAVVVGMPTESAARSRTAGFKAWFEKNAPAIKVVDTQNADWDRLKAKEVVDVWMKKYPELKAIYCNNDTMAMGAVEAVKAAGKLGQVLVVGNDGTSEAYASIKKNELSATVDIFPNFGGRISVDIALRLIGKQSVPKVIYTNQALVDPTNVNKPAEEIIGWQGLKFN
jgi:ribose transport system substrate-binding protein